MSNPLSASIHSQNFSKPQTFNRAFRFLHLLTRRLSLAGAIAHFHLDPETCDEKTIETLRPLFDAVLEVDEDGTWSMCVQ